MPAVQLNLLTREPELTYDEKRALYYRARNREAAAYEGLNDLPYERDLVAQVLVSGKGPMLADEVGVVFGCTRERIRQIEENALRKLARLFRRNGEYDELRDELLEKVRLSQCREPVYPKTTESAEETAYRGKKMARMRRAKRFVER
jgi:hypothetical protein